MHKQSYLCRAGLFAHTVFFCSHRLSFSMTHIISYRLTDALKDYLLTAYYQQQLKDVHQSRIHDLPREDIDVEFGQYYVCKTQCLANNVFMSRSFNGSTSIFKQHLPDPLIRLSCKGNRKQSTMSDKGTSPSRASAVITKKSFTAFVSAAWSPMTGAAFGLVMSVKTTPG